MSSMLDQAILDAESLREAAMKNAESAVVEKYSDEVRERVEKLLEQEPGEEEMDFGMEEDPMADPMADPTMDATAEEDPAQVAVMDRLPMGQAAGTDVVEIDLGAIMSAAQADGAQEEKANREELADEVGIPELADEEQALAPEFSEEELEAAPGNRTEDIEIDEDELVEVFKEMLTLDLPEEAEMELDAMAHEDEHGYIEELEEVPVSNARDGQEKDEATESFIEEKLQLELKYNTLIEENKGLKALLVQAKDRLEEINLSNARLLYTNRVWKDGSLNERQRKEIAQHITDAQTVDEAKTIYETLKRTNSSRPAKKSNTLSEAIQRRSSTAISSRKEVPSTENNPVKNRWAKLAGLKDN
jgi:hypothetical protein